MPDNPFGRIPPELWLTLASAGGDMDKIKSLLLKPIDWDLFLQLTLHHRVYPLVYKGLSQLNSPAVPEKVLGLLRQSYQENTLQALIMTGETIRMVKCFENHGIRVVVLKGAPLAWRLYGDIAIRPSKDIDILIPPDELEKVQGILENEGYHRAEPVYPGQNYTSRQLQIFSKAFHHTFHVSYQHGTKNIYLEVHWKLGNNVHALPLPTGKNMKMIEVAGSRLPVLADEDWLLYLMLHGAGHAWFRLRWLVDIVKFTQQGDIDWDKIAFMAKNFGLQSILHQSLVLADKLMTAPVPSNLLPVVAHDRSAWRLSCMALNLCLSDVDYLIRGSNDEYTNYLKRIYDFQLRVGWQRRFSFLLKLLGPTVNDIKLISLPDKIFGLYYLIRPVSFLYRRLRKSRAGN